MFPLILYIFVMSDLTPIISILCIYLEPILFVLSIGCNTLSIRILWTRTLRSSSYTHYLLTFTVFSILYIVQICPTQVLVAYNIFWTKTYLGCKIQYHTLYLPPMIVGIMLCLASFDRYCSTSFNIKRVQSTTYHCSYNNFYVYLHDTNIAY